MTPDETMTDALRRAVRESGLSYYAICRETGLVEDSLSRFMRGKQSLRLDKADAVAKFFGLRLTRRRR